MYTVFQHTQKVACDKIFQLLASDNQRDVTHLMQSFLLKQYNRTFWKQNQRRNQKRTMMNLNRGVMNLNKRMIRRKKTTMFGIVLDLRVKLTGAMSEESTSGGEEEGVSGMAGIPWHLPCSFYSKNLIFFLALMCQNLIAAGVCKQRTCGACTCGWESFCDRGPDC